MIVIEEEEEERKAVIEDWKGRQGRLSEREREREREIVTVKVKHMLQTFLAVPYEDTDAVRALNVRGKEYKINGRMK